MSDKRTFQIDQKSRARAKLLSNLFAQVQSKSAQLCLSKKQKVLCKEQTKNNLDSLLPPKFTLLDSHPQVKKNPPSGQKKPTEGAGEPIDSIESRKHLQPVTTIPVNTNKFGMGKKGESTFPEN